MDKEKKTKKPFKISKETVIIIVFLLLAFVVWNLALPLVFKVNVVTNVSLPQVKRGNIEFIDKEIQKRVLQVPPLMPKQENLGKQNPFE